MSLGRPLVVTTMLFGLLGAGCSDDTAPFDAATPDAGPRGGSRGGLGGLGRGRGGLGLGAEGQLERLHPRPGK